MDRKILAFIMILLLVTACSDFLEEEPKDFLTPATFPSSENDVLQIMGGVLDRQADNAYYGRFFLEVVGFGADHGNSKFLPGNERGDLDHYTFLNDSDPILSVWQTNYFTVNAMNQIMEALEGRDEEWIPGYRGAALTLRALAYFHLVQLFGDVPLVTESISNVESGLDVTRTPILEVYAQIIQDLTEAETLMAGVDLGRPGLPTEGLTKTVLAHVYLTMAGSPVQDQSMWALAAAKAKEIKDMGVYSLVRPYSDLWLIANENGPEHIFSTQRDMTDSGTRTVVNAFTRPNFIGYQSGFAQFIGSLDLFNKFTTGDERQLVSLDTVILSTETGSNTSPPRVYNYLEFNQGRNPKEQRPFTRKFFDSGRDYNAWRDFGRRAPNNFPIYRYAEVLLMIAEAENEANGPTTDAYEAINEIRDRAGLPPLAGLSQEEFRDAVWLERELELCYELKRRFDLVRWGTFFEVMSQDEFAQDGIAPHKVLYPIPASEIIINPNLTQNDGY